MKNNLKKIGIASTFGACMMMISACDNNGPEVNSEFQSFLNSNANQYTDLVRVDYLMNSLPSYMGTVKPEFHGNMMEYSHKESFGNLYYDHLASMVNLAEGVTLDKASKALYNQDGIMNTSSSIWSCFSKHAREDIQPTGLNQIRNTITLINQHIEHAVEQCGSDTKLAQAAERHKM